MTPDVSIAILISQLPIKYLLAVLEMEEVDDARKTVVAKLLVFRLQEAQWYTSNK